MRGHGALHTNTHQTYPACAPSFLGSDNTRGASVYKSSNLLCLSGRKNALLCNAESTPTFPLFP